jgi:polar amino acid transport system substrate-binding protein
MIPKTAFTFLSRRPLVLVLGVLLGLVVSGTAAMSAPRDPALAAMLPDEVRKAGVITLATDAHYPPCEFFAEDNKTVIGFEPEIWNAVGDRLGVRIDVVSITFNGLIPGVESGRYALAMECISDSAEREQQVTFIDNALGTGAVYTLVDNTTVSDDPAVALRP